MIINKSIFLYKSILLFIDIIISKIKILYIILYIISKLKFCQNCIFEKRIMQFKNYDFYSNRIIYKIHKIGCISYKNSLINFNIINSNNKRAKILFVLCT